MRPVHKGEARWEDGATYTGWSISFPALGPTFVTQGKDQRDAENMSKDLISLMLEVTEDSFDVEIPYIASSP